MNMTDQDTGYVYARFSCDVGNNVLNIDLKSAPIDFKGLTLSLRPVNLVFVPVAINARLDMSMIGFSEDKK